VAGANGAASVLVNDKGETVEEPALRFRSKVLGFTGTPEASDRSPWSRPKLVPAS